MTLFTQCKKSLGGKTPRHVHARVLPLQMAAKEEDRILYDLLVPLEWPTEREDLVSSSEILKYYSAK